jgi:hypothetical protein
MTSPSACRDEVAARTSSRGPSKGERMSFAHPGAFGPFTPPAMGIRPAPIVQLYPGGGGLNMEISVTQSFH